MTLSPEPANGPEEETAATPQVIPSPDRVSELVLRGLTDSYKELLDATKHQDDKIGRIFTGVAFLTASALAIANLNSAEALTRQYTDTQGIPLAVLSLGAYLVLVVLCVNLLITSLATPLRVPGLEDRSSSRRFRPDWMAGVSGSQIYFGAISRLPLERWNTKWISADQEGDDKRRERELAQSLVLETHNLATRTQYKYNRTTEAVILFRFALMFLSMTVVLCIAASLTPELRPLPEGTKWAVAVVLTAYIFIHFQEETRYTRQTVDELKGWRNTCIAGIRYLWAIGASIWTLLMAVGTYDRDVLVVIVLVSSVLLLISTVLERGRANLNLKQGILHWLLPVAALIAGIVLTDFGTSHGYYAALGSATIGAGLITLFALSIPTFRAWLDAWTA